MLDLKVNPLTEADLTKIDDALAAIAIGEKQIELARRAGFEVADKEKELAASKEKLLQIKQVYFPGQ